MKNMNIVLIGMRGAGKTTVGKLLAKKLGKNFIETDELIAKKENISIQQIVATYSWEHFRKRESEIIEKIAQENNAVISCGGGAIVRSENVVNLKKHGKLFWLQVGIDALLKRIGDDINRPLLTGKKSRREDMEKILQERQRLYQNAADEIVDTEHLSVDEVATVITRRCKYESTPRV